MVPFLGAKKVNIPTLRLRFLVKFLRVEKAIEVKCPTYAQGPPPLGLNIDRCIIENIAVILICTIHSIANWLS